MEIKYKFELEWTEDEGWKASFGKWRMWHNGRRFVTATIDDKDQLHNHCDHFYMQDALDHMRTTRPK